MVATCQTRSAWNTFFADFVARGLAGLRLVTNCTRAGLVEAISAKPPAASCQRCRTHNADVFPDQEAIIRPVEAIPAQQTDE